MIVIINGSVGSGKSTAAYSLQQQFTRSVMLDGDCIGAVHPFQIYDDSRIEYLYDTLLYLIKFHKSNGYQDFVINYVFETSQSLQSLVNRLETVDPKVCCYRITCSAEEQKKRIINRNSDQVDWELQRFIELNAIQEKAAKTGFIGKKFVTDGLSPSQIAERIIMDIKENSCREESELLVGS
ncbi:MAG TPA: hypothetical protein P5123_12950 [Spirochaetota bacterium]|nr:hypothetical protein [Spirochaetota bacterium]